MQKLSKGYTQYGAQMGRDSSEVSGKVRLERTRLDSGGYDNGGAYWGIGAPLYRAEDADGNVKFFRAHDRADAKSKLAGCSFYR